MISTAKTALYFALLVLVLPAPGSAQETDWNDPLVKKALGDHGIILNTDENAAAAGRVQQQLLEAEMYVESERLGKSGVQVLKFNKQLASVPNLPKEFFTDVQAAGNLPTDGMFEYIEVETFTAPDGTIVNLQREMSPEEVMNRRMENSDTPPEMAAVMMDTMSDGLLMLGAAMREGITDAGFGGILGDEDMVLEGIAGGHGDFYCDSFLRDPKYAGVRFQTDSPDQGIMMSGISEHTGEFYPVLYMFGPACMLAKSAEALENYEDPTPGEYAEAQEKARNEAMQYASFGGMETVDGQRAARIDVEDLGIRQPIEGGGTMEIDTLSIWIDPQYLKRRKFRMQGTMIEGREKRKFFMERENQDYRRVGDSFLYEPYLEIVRVGGVLSEKERKELAEAQEELKKAEAQLAQMPAAQRKMMEKMMGKQMDQLRSMAEDGSMEMRIITTSIEINPDFSAPGFGGMVTAGTDPNASLVQVIQGYLAQLGYDPGPATGELTTETVIAISQYQAEKGLAVTGEASAELARRLQAEVDAL